MFFNQKNEWNQDVKSNFESFEFWIGPISKFALVRIIVFQFKNLNLKLCVVFTQEFEFRIESFITSILRNLISQPSSEARCSSITQNQNKSLIFHNCVTKGMVIQVMEVYDYIKLS